jgi:hypothetical protein
LSTAYDIAFILTHPETWAYQLIKMLLPVKDAELYNEIIRVASGSTGYVHYYKTPLGNLTVRTDTVLGATDTGKKDPNDPPVFNPTLFQKYKWWTSGFDIERVYAKGSWYLVKFPAKLDKDPSIVEYTFPFNLTVSTGWYGEATQRQIFTVNASNLIGGEIDVTITMGGLLILYERLFLNKISLNDNLKLNFEPSKSGLRIYGDVSDIIKLGDNELVLTATGSFIGVTASGTLKVVGSYVSVTKSTPETVSGVKPPPTPPPQPAPSTPPELPPRTGDMTNIAIGIGVGIAAGAAGYYAYKKGWLKKAGEKARSAIKR